mmetsp:Transcript_26687/g.58841  ORF Transcript_26687/g.58841 Transcript_26687/m.58841 type:complete len:1052 (-) Transcript_26687:363-3518(-)
MRIGHVLLSLVVARSTEGAPTQALVIASLDGVITMHDPWTGEPRDWIQTGGPVVSTSASSSQPGQDKIVPTLDGSLFFEDEDGRLVEFPFTVLEVTSSPTPYHFCEKSEGGPGPCSLLTGERTWAIFALDVEQGTVRWVHSEGNTVDIENSTRSRSVQHWERPRQRGEPVLLQRDRFVIRAIDAHSGVEAWNVSLSHFAAVGRTAPNVQAGARQIGDQSAPSLPLLRWGDDTNQVLHAVHPDTGEDLWQRSMSSEVVGVFGADASRGWLELAVPEAPLEHGRCISAGGDPSLPSSGCELQLAEEAGVPQLHWSYSAGSEFGWFRGKSLVALQRQLKQDMGHAVGLADRSISPDLLPPAEDFQESNDSSPNSSDALESGINRTRDMVTHEGLFLTWATIAAVVVILILIVVMLFIWRPVRECPSAPASPEVGPLQHRSSPMLGCQAPEHLDLGRHDRAPSLPPCRRGADDCSEGARQRSSSASGGARSPPRRPEPVQRKRMSPTAEGPPDKPGRRRAMSESSSPHHERAASTPAADETDSIIRQAAVCDRYRTEFEEAEMLGSGGFGRVFRCHKKIEEIDYAVKQIPLSSDQKYRTTMKRMLREVKVLARLDHHNIVRYFQAWVEKSRDDGEDGLESDSGPDSAGVARDLQSSCAAGMDETELSLAARHKPYDARVCGDDTTQQSWGTMGGDESSFGGFQWDRGSSRSEVVASPSRRQHRSRHSQAPSRRKADKSKSQQDFDLVLFIQMQFCPQQTLHHMLAKPRRQVDVAAMLGLFEQVTNGIKYVHECQLIHRDLKPSNIFLLEGSRIKIGDFGLATKLGDAIGTEDLMSVCPSEGLSRGVGTYIYASPEQRGGQDYSNKTDIFSLGIILFELLNKGWETSMGRMLDLEELSAQNRLPNSWKEGSDLPEIKFLLEEMIRQDPALRPAAAEVHDRIEAFQGKNRISPPTQGAGGASVVLRVEATSNNGIGVVHLVKEVMKSMHGNVKCLRYGFRSGKEEERDEVPTKESEFDVMEFALSYEKLYEETLVDKVKALPNVKNARITRCYFNSD